MPDGVFGPWPGTESFCESWEERKKEGEMGHRTWDFHCRGQGQEGATGQKPAEPPGSTALLAMEPDTSKQMGLGRGGGTSRFADLPPANADSNLLFRGWEPGVILKHPYPFLPHPICLSVSFTSLSSGPPPCPCHRSTNQPSSLSPVRLLQRSAKAFCLQTSHLFSLCFLLTAN